MAPLLLLLIHKHTNRKHHSGIKFNLSPQNKFSLLSLAMRSILVLIFVVQAGLICAAQFEERIYHEELTDSVAKLGDKLRHRVRCREQQQQIKTMIERGAELFAKFEDHPTISKLRERYDAYKLELQQYYSTTIINHSSELSSASKAKHEPNSAESEYELQQQQQIDYEELTDLVDSLEFRVQLQEVCRGLPDLIKTLIDRSKELLAIIGDSTHV